MRAAQEPSDDENDMLDLAFGLTQTSRLGCQVEASKELDGLVVRLPSVRAACVLHACPLLTRACAGDAQFCSRRARSKAALMS